ncbi:MAG: DUF4394 domain-containing protein [Pseudomonadota bacterium]
MLMNKIAASLIGAAAALAFSTSALAAPTNTNKLSVIGLTDVGTLVSFKLSSPSGTTREIGSVQGLVGDTALVGIDFRVQNGALYGVGNAGGIYLIDTTTAAASLQHRLTVALSGTRFGVDFNPAANALRIISDNGQNLRQPFPAVGSGAPFVATASDASLNTGVGTPAPVVSGVTAAAYVNNDLSTVTATTLYDINVSTGQVVVQSPANSGIVVASGSLAVPGLTGNASFDIHSDLNEAGETISNRAFAALATASGTSVYSVDFSSGRATEIGAINPAYALRDIALPLGQ